MGRESKRKQKNGGKRNNEKRSDLPIGCVDDRKDNEVLEQVARVNDQGWVHNDVRDGLEWDVVGSERSGRSGRRGDEKPREGNEMKLSKWGMRMLDKKR